MTHSADSVLLSIDAEVAHIRFNRSAALNAMDAEMAGRLRDLVRQAQADGGVRVFVLSGEGKAFMAGGDLQAFHADLKHADDVARAIIDPLNEALLLLATGDAPVVASVHGAVAGAGMSIALGADLAIAAHDVKFNMAYARIGASLDGGGSWALPRVVGLRRAMSIALLSESLDAATALDVGIVNRVVPADALEAETRTLAMRLAKGPTHAFGRIRRLLRDGLQRDYAGQLQAERDAFAQGAVTKDFSEGVNAFFSKRSPVFTGT